MWHWSEDQGKERERERERMRGRERKRDLLTFLHRWGRHSSIARNVMPLTIWLLKSDSERGIERGKERERE